MDKITLFNAMKEKLSYNSDSGAFTWLYRNERSRGDVWFNTRFAGKKAGNINQGGYMKICISINSKAYTVLAHQLAFYLTTGSIANGDIDHINQIKHDNRACNLRIVTRSENLRNATRSARNKSGITGVCFVSKAKKWLAQTTVNGKNRQIGFFDNIKDAEAAVILARRNQGFSEAHGADKPA